MTYEAHTYIILNLNIWLTEFNFISFELDISII